MACPFFLRILNYYTGLRAKKSSSTMVHCGTSVLVNVKINGKAPVSTLVRIILLQTSLNQAVANYSSRKQPCQRRSPCSLRRLCLWPLRPRACSSHGTCLNLTAAYKEGVSFQSQRVKWKNKGGEIRIQRFDTVMYAAHLIDVPSQLSSDLRLAERSWISEKFINLSSSFSATK